MKAAVLIVGGAGYIGANMAKQLCRSGYAVVVLDNLSTGFRTLAQYGKLIVGDLADGGLIERLVKEYRIDAAMHFAACSLVGESVENPGKYYRNNVAGTLDLLEAMVRHGV